MSIAALVVAAGTGERFGGSTPKQYRTLSGIPLLRRTLAPFAEHPDIDRVEVVIHPDHHEMYDAATAGMGADSIDGGATRQASVLRGLKHLAIDAPEYVLIHDGARPLVESCIIDRVVRALVDSDAVVPALPIADAIKRVEDRRVDADVDRADLWRAQTPQGFRFDVIYRASETVSPNENYPDDAAVAMACGSEVTIVDGANENLKVTSASDLDQAERILLARLGDVRVGSGFDTHRFVPGNCVRLCGVDIPAASALAGHSDADVALHAVTDALLGATADGDIGTHFPPSDDRWRNADSQIFLRHALDLIRTRGGAISHIDLTLICELPKIAPHRIAMRDRLAALLELPAHRVSIKATTTEQLGFTGRGEGVAAQATATVRLPVS